MKLKNIITTLLLIFIVTQVFSQEKGSVFLSVFPKDAVIKLNDSLLTSYETYPLDTGSYTFKMWSPTREYVERNITITTGKTTRLHEVLSYTESYKDYKKSKRMYTIGKGFMRYISPVILVFFVQNSLSTWKDLDDKVTYEYDQANSFKDKYENEVFQSNLLVYKNAYETHRTAYEENLEAYNSSRKNRMMIGGALIVTTAALEYISFKIKKPEYKEKVLLSSFGLNNYNNKLSPSISLTYKFN